MRPSTAITLAFVALSLALILNAAFNARARTRCNARVAVIMQAAVSAAPDRREQIMTAMTRADEAHALNTGR